jgi:hypothetical protein
MAGDEAGIPEDVSDLGAVASLWCELEAEEPPVRTFYPWSSVARLRPEEEI